MAALAGGASGFARAGSASGATGAGLPSRRAGAPGFGSGAAVDPGKTFLISARVSSDTANGTSIDILSRPSVATCVASPAMSAPSGSDSARSVTVCSPLCTASNAYCPRFDRSDRLPPSSTTTAPSIAGSVLSAVPLLFMSRTTRPRIDPSGISPNATCRVSRPDRATCRRGMAGASKSIGRAPRSSPTSCRPSGMFLNRNSPFFAVSTAPTASSRNGTPATGFSPGSCRPLPFQSA